SRLDSRERKLVKHLAEAESPTQDGSAKAELKLDVLDSAILYADLRSYKNEAYKRNSHRLKVLRAQMGSQKATKPNESLALDTASRPELGHDPARFGLGIGSLSDKAYQELQFRFAYHHLLSIDIGYLPLTHL